MSVLSWEPDNFLAALRKQLKGKVDEYGALAAFYIEDMIGTQGSITPPVFSSPEQPPYRQDGTLQRSIRQIDGHQPISTIVYSDAIDEHVDPGHHYSFDVEFGHYWDGWAYDWADGRIKMIARPHFVEPRPFMVPGLRDTEHELVRLVSEASAPISSTANEPEMAGAV